MDEWDHTNVLEKLKKSYESYSDSLNNEVGYILGKMGIISGQFNFGKFDMNLGNELYDYIQNKNTQNVTGNKNDGSTKKNT